jgi:hypothetical protein
MALTVVVRGVGDVGSAVAHRLFVEGYAVVIHDGPTPTTTRRGMAFADAVSTAPQSSRACMPYAPTILRESRKPSAITVPFPCMSATSKLFSPTFVQRSSSMLRCASTNRPTSNVDSRTSPWDSARALSPGTMPTSSWRPVGIDWARSSRTVVRFPCRVNRERSAAMLVTAMFTRRSPGSSGRRQASETLFARDRRSLRSVVRHCGRPLMESFEV